MVHDRFGDCWFLRQGEGFQLAGEREDLPRLGRGTDYFELGIHADYRSFAHVFASDSALVRGHSLVVPLGHFRAVSLLKHQLLLREEVVGEHPVKFPDLVEQGKLGGGAAATLGEPFREGVKLSVVRHEALFVRMEVEDLRLLAVVAVG